MLLIHAGKLNVIDIARVNYSHDYLDYMQAMLNMDLSRLESHADADRMLSDVVADEITRLFLLQNLVLNKDVYSWRINQPVLIKHHADILDFPRYPSSFAAPTLFIPGVLSDYVAERHHKSIPILPRCRICGDSECGALRARRSAKSVA